MVDFLIANQTLSTYSVRKWSGRYGEIYTYRHTNQLPLRGGQDAINVNWCEITITREDTGEQIYHNAFITDFEVRRSNVEAIVCDGRARWKIENENNNILKTKGYHLEHNFGHGLQYLASFLLTLNLLAFLFHTVLDLVDARYQMICRALLNRDHDPFLDQWELDLTTHEAKLKYAGKIDLSIVKQIERRVTEYIQQSFRFVAFEMATKEERLKWVSRIIPTSPGVKNVDLLPDGWDYIHRKRKSEKEDCGLSMSFINNRYLRWNSNRWVASGGR